MIGILLTVLVAALVYLILAALTGSAIVAIIGAILVLITTGTWMRRVWPRPREAQIQILQRR